MAVLVVAAVFWGITLAVNSPGHLSYDSIMQLGEGRSRIYDSIHPPLMSALLGLADAIVPGTAVYLVFSSALFFVAIVLMNCHTTKPRLTAVLLALVLALPVVLVYQGIVWKDVLFANAALLAFALLVAADATPRRRRWVLYAAAASGIGLAALIRQNGFLVAALLIAAIGWMEYEQSRATRRRALHALGVAACSAVIAAGVATLAMALVQATAARPLNGSTEAGLVVLAQYDIAGITVRDPDVRLEPLAADAADRADFRKAVRDSYTPRRVTFMIDSEAMGRQFDKITPDETLALWWRLILANPSTYYAHRASVFRELMLPSDPAQCAPVHAGVFGPPDLSRELRLRSETRPSDQALLDYTRHFVGGPLMLPMAYAAGAFVLLAMLLLQPRRGRTAVMFMLLSALAFAGSYAVIGIACDFRYAYFLVVATLGALLFMVAGRRSDDSVPDVPDEPRVAASPQGP